jgi:hypothetical protein
MMRSRGNSTQMFFRLCWRAPIILIVSVDIGRNNNGKQSPKHKSHEPTSPDIPLDGDSPQRRRGHKGRNGCKIGVVVQGETKVKTKIGPEDIRTFGQE